MADHWNNQAAAAAGQQQNNLRRLEDMWDSLDKQLSLFCQVLTLDPGVYDSLDVAAREFLKQKMRTRYNCDALYIADSGIPGRVFLAPTFALTSEKIGICTPRPYELPVVIDQGSLWVGGQEPAQQQQHLDQVIQKSVQQAVQHAMQQSFKHLSVSGPKDSPQKPIHGSEYSDGYVDSASKYRKSTYASGGPRPANSFILYRKHVQKQVVAQNPGKSNNEISKIIGQQWHNLPEDEKDYWKGRQDEVAYQHSLMYPNYRYTPRQKSEKDNKNTPTKSRTPKEARSEMPQPTTFGDDETEDIKLDPKLEQEASVALPESFFDQAMTSPSPVE
ncbi:silenced mating-type M-specific polypeptide Mc [Apiospora arundinis]